MMYLITIYLRKHSIRRVLANIPKQSIQGCTPLANKQFAAGFHSDLMTGWRHINNKLCKREIIFSFLKAYIKMYVDQGRATLHHLFRYSGQLRLNAVFHLLV